MWFVKFQLCQLGGSTRARRTGAVDGQGDVGQGKCAFVRDERPGCPHSASGSATSGRGASEGRSHLSAF